ncbi:hypothetical protein JJQ58_00790 [Mammaliicoccus fleurettii]|uniref:Uncharacterized protein n=1 Tax=Mammaliicoccus fleurettii TaxID=150056 RepID=A0ABS5MJD9_9STAP|nr:hypothetical protein [Mammaliicoccus fleurettii]MBL0846514.1 hypothetical protein [Mammaliicoccus fleurettii]MBS3670955.1 hypothetical protein [Mammaliicoccus fleurettii]MBS3696014.1 hypothetical protein [Mammaliicoccus fleurettii]
MAIDFITREKFQEFIKLISESAIDKFTPSKFAKYADININDSFKLLMEHVATKELEISWELRCPNCSRALSLNNNKDFEEYECDFCYETFDVDENDLFPKFKITDKYKEYLISSRNDGHSEKKFKKTVTNIPDEKIPMSDIMIDEQTKEILLDTDCPIILNIFQGDNYVNQNSNSFNNSNISNTNIQSNNNQCQTVPNEHIEELEDYITNLDDVTLKKMNENYLTDLKSSLAENDKEKAKDILAFMGRTLGSIASLTTIGGYLN